MPATPEVEPLAYARRRRFFLLLVIIFAMSVPVFVFYATGYRYNFFADDPTITTTGGMYVSAEAENAQIFLNEEPVRSLRVFRNAAYIQGLTPGVHRLHVQAPGLQTWVKELPVHGQLVTEAAAFNLPQRPQVRPITEYVTATGAPVYFGVASTSLPFSFASTSRPLLSTSTTATTSFVASPEYEFVDTLFTATTTPPSIVGRVIEGVSNTFRFAEELGTSTAATTTVERDEIKLYQAGAEVYATFTGSPSDFPYYFCIPFGKSASTSALYGDHVLALITQSFASSTRSIYELEESERLCRDRIRLDRKWQEVHWFNFLPGDADLVLLLLDEGLYVVEIDDRAWQNTQVLYPGENLEVALNGGQIFVKDDGRYLEVLTELIEPLP